MAKPYHGQGGDENDDAAEGNLQEGEVIGLKVQTKNRREKIVNRIHNKILSLEN
jgi:hypothetical protein